MSYQPEYKISPKQGMIVVMDDDTATTDPQDGDYIRIEGFLVHEIATDESGAPYMIVEKV